MALWPQCPEVGIHSGSAWNKPEPEIALAANSRGETVGASLGNNVNPRNFKGSSSMVKISRTRRTGRRPGPLGCARSTPICRRVGC